MIVTIVMWTLITTAPNIGVVEVDNFRTEQECEEAMDLIIEKTHTNRGACVQKTAQFAIREN